MSAYGAWLAGLRARADQPPVHPRVPLWAGDARIGSVEPSLLQDLPRISEWVAQATCHGVAGWQVHGDVTAALGHVALALRDAGLSHAWRDEQLAVVDDAGALRGTVERAVVRPLGIATSAVHLAGFSPDGRMWVQQRALTKPNDPGLWDTLMGGMVPASDTVREALARETWEEAGLQLTQLEALAHGGCVVLRKPTGDGGPGYVVERVDWFRCVVPDRAIPVNQDGEVAQFALLARDELVDRLLRDEFTTEAALVIANCLAGEG